MQDLLAYFTRRRVDASSSLLQHPSGAYCVDLSIHHTDPWRCGTTNWHQHADDAQQAFSAATILTLQHVLPVLEKLYASWDKAATKPRYNAFVPALTAGMAKLNMYSTTSEVPSQMRTLWQWVCIVSFSYHMLCITDHCAVVLDPSKKMTYSGLKNRCNV